MMMMMMMMVVMPVGAVSCRGISEASTNPPRSSIYTVEPLVRNMDDESSQINYELYRAVDERWLERESAPEKGGHKIVSITRRVDGACLVR
uniref:Putative secreted peptide n=1 Tax=Anopheles braziliensis TaxID=58242 RepID=A0A2M3ZNT3_9DIPT